MSEKRGDFIWKILKRKSRKELDRVQADLVKGSSEKRDFAGDPAQAKWMHLKLKQAK